MAPPRIYSAHGSESGSARWLAKLGQIRKMGFTHVLVARDASARGAPAKASGAANVRVANDFAAAPPSLTAEVQICSDHGLQLLLDIDVLCADAATLLRAQHADRFRVVASSEDLPDPRHRPREAGLQWRLDDARAAQAALEWWRCHLLDYARAGVTGFRLLSVDAAPSAWWKALCVHVHALAPGTLMLAWTQGLKPPSVAALVGTGFDDTFCSAEWWDYRGSWLASECRRLAAVAPPLACAGAAVTADARRTGTLQAHRRAVWFASTLGLGWLLPDGFERGSDAAEGGLPAQHSRAKQHVDQLPAAFALVADVTAANAALIAERATAGRLPTLHAAVGWAGILRACGDQARLLLINADLERPIVARLAAIGGGAACAFAPWRDDSGHAVSADCPLAPGQVLRLHAVRSPSIVQRLAAPMLHQRLEAATHSPRIAIESVTPGVDAGRFPVKRVVGDSVHVEADVFMDGHEVLAVALCWRACDEEVWHEERMRPLGNDRYAARFVPVRVGRHEYTVQAWHDAYASYRHELEVKHDAEVPIELELEEGRLLLEQTIAVAEPAETQALRAVIAQLAGAADDQARYRLLMAAETSGAMAQADPRPFAVRHVALPLEVDRRAAQFASWYELFPRSQTDDPARHGSFRDVIARLPAIREMGFDVLYFPPIHPIGDAFRKGRNNSLSPTPEDPGSPYAIGSAQGGHTAIHTELGSIEDFRALRDAALEQGLELALDFAIQCSPDHPWLREHPEWFDWRPDGSLRYAENPPKKYQDIVNVDFYADGAVPSLWQALCDVVLYWANEGVRSFRVDNPHTKPYPFWEWLIARVRSAYPDALFLAEAFTRPKRMYRLAKAGFNQSSTYFTWRHTKQEFTEYLTELTQGPARDFFRPNFFVNTPDINPHFLQRSGRSGFLIRAALAATLSGLWGMYSGFELCEGAALPGREEYLDSEKYEIKPRDWTMPGNIVAEISQLNAIRRAQPALQSHLGVRFLLADDPQVLFFERFVPNPGGVSQPLDRVLVAILLDPVVERDTGLHLPLAAWGLAADAALCAQDLLHDVTATWRGARQRVWLGRGMPYAIWHLQETF